MNLKEKRLLYYYILTGLAICSFLFFTVPFVKAEWSGYNQSTGIVYTDEVLYNSVLSYVFAIGGNEKAFIYIEGAFHNLCYLFAIFFDLALLIVCIIKAKQIKRNDNKDTYNKLGETVTYIFFALIFALAFITTKCEANLRSGRAVATKNIGSLEIGAYLEFFVYILIAVFFLLIYLSENKENEKKAESNIKQDHAPLTQELLKWKELLDSGVISQEEYEEIKHKLINKIQ